jgi:peptidoglycan LD-endopeptidase LytH
MILGGVVRATCLVALSIYLAGCSPEPTPGASGKSSVPMVAPRKVELIWPTPNDVFLRGGGLEQFVQPTASGELRSGLFGSVRSGGRKFHEGLDLFPLKRDAKGEAIDEVRAAMAGIVCHISAREGASSYGRYVVLEHPDQSPAVYTLYAHLARIEPGLRRGLTLAAGAPLGVMGRSAGGYAIPRERAHLHFEIGVRMTDRFQEWYKARGFGSPNEHGLWNGMNLMGLDPLSFYERSRAGGLARIAEVFANEPVAVRARVARATEPDYARRYPVLVAAGAPSPGAGWEIDFSVTGVPLRLRRLAAADVAEMRRGELRVVEADMEFLRANRGRQLVKMARGQAVSDEDLVTVVEQLFGR